MPAAAAPSAPPASGPCAAVPLPWLVLGFSAGNGLFDHLIRAVELRLQHDSAAPRPTATHVWLELHWLAHEGARSLGVEAISPNVRLFDPASKRGSSGHIRRCRVPCTTDEALHAWAWAKRHVGDGYDYAGILKCLWYILSGQPDRFYSDRTARVFCSELVTASLRAGGLALLNGTPADDVTPAWLETWAAAHDQSVP